MNCLTSYDRITYNISVDCMVVDRNDDRKVMCLNF